MREKFRSTLPAEWVKYFVVVILSIALWIWGFGLYHAPKDTEKIVLFFAGEVKNYAFETDAADAFEELKTVSISAAYPWTGNAFDQKYSVVGLTASDVVIVPESVAMDTDCATAFVPLEGLGEPFEQKDVAYGVYLSDAVIKKLSRYFVFREDRYVVFAVGASVNSGEETDLSIRFIEWLVR